MRAHGEGRYACHHDDIHVVAFVPMAMAVTAASCTVVAEVGHTHDPDQDMGHEVECEWDTWCLPMGCLPKDLHEQCDAVRDEGAGEEHRHAYEADQCARVGEGDALLQEQGAAGHYV